MYCTLASFDLLHPHVLAQAFFFFFASLIIPLPYTAKMYHQQSECREMMRALVFVVFLLLSALSAYYYG